MNSKTALDELFNGVNFNTALYKKIVHNNVEFITRNSEFKHLFGSRLIGCFYIKYTMYDKDIFYNNLFNISSKEVIDAIDKITTINKNFKVARDDINMVCFYIAHRFLSNKDLKKEQAFEYAKEILNYFSYRTLVLISSNYFVYPISEEKALTLMERLNNKYIIKKLKNWNEYCIYRSDEYLNNKYVDILTSFNKDDELPNAITDLFNRTKDTIKNIYREFIDMIENDDIIKTKKSVITDVDGQKVMADKLDTPEKYFIRIESMLHDKSVFVRQGYVNIVTDIINSVSSTQVTEMLKLLTDYTFSGKAENTETITFVKSVLINAIEYLSKSNIQLHSKADFVSIINEIIGNVLYARGTDIEINTIKDKGDKLIKKIYKASKVFITDRNIKNLRNALYVYIVLRSLISD